MIRGGVSFRPTTDIVLFGMRLVESAGPSFSLAVTSASDSSGETATLKGGPTTLPGTSSRSVSWNLLPNVDRRRIEDQVRSGNARYTASHGARASVDGTARARRRPRGRAWNLLAAYAAAVSAQPHQLVAARRRPGLDHRRHGRRPRRHACALGAHLRDAPRRPSGAARARDALPSRPHGQRRLAHR